MALDATDENVGVLDILINTVQTDLGDLAVKVFPSQTDEGSPGAVHVPGTPPKTATGAQSGDVKVTLASIEGLIDDLMSLIEDGSLKQTPALTNLIKTLIMLKDEALALDDVFEPGNSIDATDLARLESFYHDFGSALVLAREGAAADSDPVVMTQTRGQLRIGATTDDETGDVEDVAMDDSDDAEPVTDDTDPDADLEAATTFLAEKSAETTGITEVVDALDSVGSTDAETDETGEVDPLADPEVVDVPEPEPTLADVTAEARELMAGLNNLDDLLMFMLELQADGDSIQFIDAVTLGPYIDKVAAKLTEIGEMVNQLVNSDTPDVQGALDYLAEQRAEIADIQDFADSVVVTLPDDLDVPFTDLDETGPPAPTDAADGPTRTDATTTTQDLLDELSALDAEILGILMEQYDADEPQLVDGVVWAPYMELITKLQGDIPEQVLEFLGGPDPDVQGALDFLAEQGDIVANIRDFIDSLKNGGQTADPDPTNPPALDWDDAAPATRIDLAELSQSLLDNFGALVFDLMVLLETQADADNPQLIDAIDWGGFLDDAKALIAEIKAEFPALLSGDLTSGDYTDADIQAAFTYLEKKKAEFENLRGRVDAFVDMDPLAVDQGRVWGDPHFVGADGGKYDVQGVAGNYYNILSDDGLQVNARFDEFAGPNSGQTVMGAIGITLGTDTVEVSATEGVKINGETVEAGTYLDGKVTVLENGSVEINEQEYSFRIDARENSAGDHLNIENIQSDNAAADGVLPSGLWGVTVDYDDDARNGDAGQGTQGGGAIEGLDGEITERGDTKTVGDYEVSGLFDVKFDHHNQFGSEEDEADV